MSSLVSFISGLQLICDAISWQIHGCISAGGGHTLEQTILDTKITTRREMNPTIFRKIKS